jgi:hypothetical protein
MRYTIINRDGCQILEVVGYSIFFAWDESSNYDAFRVALENKGIDAFVDLLIVDAANAFLLFCQP